MLATGSSTHSVYKGGGVVRLIKIAGVCHRLSSVACNTGIYNATHKGASRGGPVVLRPVKATHCGCFVVVGNVGAQNLRCVQVVLKLVDLWIQT